MKKQNLIWGLIVAVLLVYVLINPELDSQTQTVIGECLSDEYCIDNPTPKPGHVVDAAECINGKCEFLYLKVAEVCNNDFDDDRDGLVDCEDPECELTRYCLPLCPKVSVSRCEINKCWCPDTYSPKWVIAEEDNYCMCG